MLISDSSRLSLWHDSSKSNAFSGSIEAGEALYVEGLTKSSAVNREELVWQYTRDGETLHLTNSFTVLSQRIFADLDFDGDVDAYDKALQKDISPEYGWTMPVNTNAFRIAQLRTDVGLPGIYTLRLDGAPAFKVWQSPDPYADDAPFLVSGQVVTNGVDGVYWGTSSTANLYLQAIAPGTATLTYTFTGTGEAEGIVSQTSLKMTAWRLSLVPDYDRDGAIDWRDQSQAAANRVFRWWINDDADAEGDFTGASGIPGQTPGNHSDGVVNGLGDLIDFFPLWLDLHDVLDMIPPEGDVQYRLRQSGGSVKAVYTDLARTAAGSYMVASNALYGPAFDSNAHEAPVFEIPTSGVALERGFLDRIAADPAKGVLLLEGAAQSSAPLELEVWKGAARIGLVEMPMSIDGVEEMYRWHNIRDSATMPERIGEPGNRPDAECKNTDVFLAHGFRVSENESRAWGSEFFKRLWREGMNARFHAVTWSADSGSSISYEDNVNIAFLTASNYAARVGSVKATNQSEVVVMGHSLGCMLTSAAIADHHLPAAKFLALNGAVPSEAFDAAMADERTNSLNRLLHPYWRGYMARTWSANWHRLFADPDAFPGDDRAALTWRGRFDGAAPVLYNFWSSGDEVLEIAADSDILATTGIEWDWSFSGQLINARRYVWHKQALFKGRSPLYGTTWAGWGFWEWMLPLVGNVYSRDEANALGDDTLRAEPVFRHNPDEMLSSNIVKSVQNNLLARGIPELSFPIGYVSLSTSNCVANVDMHVDLRREDKAWPQRTIDFSDKGQRPNRWLHTDLINQPHYYTHKLYRKLVEEGDMK